MKTFFAVLTFLFSVQLVIGQEAALEFNDLKYVETDQTLVDSLQRLNLVVPDRKEKAPLFIWIGGGAWSYVDRHVEMNFARRMANEGIAVASVGHRLSPATWVDSKLNTGIEHPEHTKDLASAIKWLWENADQYKLDRNNFFIGGFSSGAHLAALICMDDSYLKSHNLSKDIFNGVVPVSGTFDIKHYFDALQNSDSPELADLHVKAVFGKDESEFPNASPITFLEHLSTPILLMSDYNTIDYSLHFERKLKEIKTVEFESYHVRQLSHSDLWRNLSNAEDSEHRNKIINFIRNNLKTG